MRIGIIIVYQGKNEPLKLQMVQDCFNDLKDMEICLVHNNDAFNSAGQISPYLVDVKNLHLLNVRKSKSSSSTIRAGARFMYNRFHFEHLGHVSCSSFEDILRVIRMVQANKGDIINWSQSRYSKTSRKMTQYKDVFSLTRYFGNAKIEYQFA